MCFEMASFGQKAKWKKKEEAFWEATVSKTETGANEKDERSNLVRISQGGWRGVADGVA